MNVSLESFSSCFIELHKSLLPASTKVATSGRCGVQGAQRWILMIVFTMCLKPTILFWTCFHQVVLGTIAYCACHTETNIGGQ